MRWFLARLRRTRLAGDAGVSLLEVVVAMAILAVVSLGLLYGIVATMRMSADGRARVVAANLAGETIDKARAVANDKIDTIDTASWTETIGGRTYTVLQSAQWQPRTGSGSPCDSGSGSAYVYKRVSVRVTWPDMGSTDPVRSDTLLTPGVGGFDPTRGNFAVKVLKADGSPNELVNVTVSGPASDSLMTDENGCAFFNQLPAGTTYTVGATKTGHVSDERVVAPTETGLAITAGATTAVQFAYDVAGKISLVNPLPTYPVPPTVQLALGNTSLSGGRLLVPAPATYPATVSDVFPYPAGYRVWLGSCLSADPDGVQILGAGAGSRFWPTAPPAPVATVTPTGTPETAIAGAEVEVLVKLAGVPAPGVQVRAVHAADSGGGCTTGETHVLGTTDSSGKVRATLPYGTSWSFKTTLLTTANIALSPNDTAPKVVTLP